MSTKHTPGPAASISRTQRVPTPGTNYRLAWTWVYTVDYGRVLPGVGSQTAVFDRLDAARRACARHGFTPVEAWK